MKQIGIIGGGSISDTHARAAREIEGVELAAFYGDNFEKTAQLSERYGGTVYQDFESFLNHRPMDIVIIGSPSALHAEQGSRRRGAGFMCSLKNRSMSRLRRQMRLSGMRTRAGQARRLFSGSRGAGHCSAQAVSR